MYLLKLFTIAVLLVSLYQTIKLKHTNYQLNKALTNVKAISGYGVNND